MTELQALQAELHWLQTLRFFSRLLILVGLVGLMIMRRRRRREEQEKRSPEIFDGWLPLVFVASFAVMSGCAAPRPPAITPVQGSIAGPLEPDMVRVDQGQYRVVDVGRGLVACERAQWVLGELQWVPVVCVREEPRPVAGVVASVFDGLARLASVFVLSSWRDR